MKEEFKMSEALRSGLSNTTLLEILSRSDKLVQNTIDQLNETASRGLTFFGLMLTYFTGLTAFILSVNGNYRLLIPAVILWIGLGVSMFVLFKSVIAVFQLRLSGNEPRNLCKENVLDFFAQSQDTEGYYRHVLCHTIESNQDAIEMNTKTLHERTHAITLAMQILGMTIGIVAFTTLLLVAISSLH